MKDIVVNEAPTAIGVQTQETNQQEIVDVPVTDSLCKNDYYPVAKGVTWEYVTTFSNSNIRTFLQIRVSHVVADGVYLYSNFSATGQFPPVDNPIETKWNCVPEGVTEPLSGPGDLYIPNEMPAGLVWKGATGTVGETTSTSLGVESVTVPAGTFDAVRVKDDNISAKGIASYRWYVKGIGLVKVYYEFDNNYQSQELMSYTVPTP